MNVSEKIGERGKVRLEKFFKNQEIKYTGLSLKYLQNKHGPHFSSVLSYGSFMWSIISIRRNNWLLIFALCEKEIKHYSAKGILYFHL